MNFDFSIFQAYPERKSTNLQSLRVGLSQTGFLAFDTETDDLRPHIAPVVGFGVYSPSLRQAWYINVGHSVSDPKVLRYTETDLVEVLAPWFAYPGNHAVAHNAAFDLRILFRLGIYDIRCRVSCTMHHVHRINENLRLRSETGDGTYYYHLPQGVGYGLKNLTTLFFKQQPPTLAGTTGYKSVSRSKPSSVAAYCIQDCVNTANLYFLADQLATPKVRELMRDIDDPCNAIVARMMWAGVLVDVEEALRQKEINEHVIRNCKAEIRRLLGVDWQIRTPNHIRRILGHLRFKEELDYDPYEVLEDADEGGTWIPSIASSKLSELIDQLEGKNETKAKVIALLLAQRQAEQRINAFLVPLTTKSWHFGNRLYLDRFDSLLTTTRYSCSPNVQNLPGRADKGDPWERFVPDHCLAQVRTRNIIIARDGHQLVSMDLSAAEPRYLALHFQRSLRTKDSDYWMRRRIAEQRRWATYPVLMELKRTLSKPPTRRGYEIIWPEIENDPLWEVFAYGKFGGDPYSALLAGMMPAEYEQARATGAENDWLAENRWRGKKAFLAFAYGAGADTLAPQLFWTVERTQEAIDSIEKTYPVLNPLRNLTWMNMVHFGEVESLWGRPRRINGYWQLAQGDPCWIHHYRRLPDRMIARGYPKWRLYQSKVIPLGATNPSFQDDKAKGGGMLQCFLERCEILGDDDLELIFEADSQTGEILYRSPEDMLLDADHFNRLPFRNIAFSQIRYVEPEPGLRHHLPRQHRAARAAFNSLCQVAGADHLRWLMNEVDAKVCTQPTFNDCRLILTVHDSLVYEVPDAKVEAFIEAARPIVAQRPYWSDIDMKVDVEVGKRFGEMRKV